MRVQKRVEVLEHRLTTGLESMPLLKRWRPALVVITLDNFLHVFDLPAEVSPSRECGDRPFFRRSYSTRLACRRARAS